MVADNIVTMLIDNDVDADDIRRAFRGEGVVIDALKSYIDSDVDEWTEDDNLDIDIDPSNTTVSFGRPINYSTVSSTTTPNARSSGGLSKQILNLRTDPSKISVNSLSKRITHVRATVDVSKPNKIIF
jgi:hypothetical protein